MEQIIPDIIECSVQSVASSYNLKFYLNAFLTTALINLPAWVTNNNHFITNIPIVSFIKKLLFKSTISCSFFSTYRFP
jgi:hypothetical protein